MVNFPGKCHDIKSEETVHAEENSIRDLEQGDVGWIPSTNTNCVIFGGESSLTSLSLFAHVIKWTDAKMTKCRK